MEAALTLYLTVVLLWPMFGGGSPDSNVSLRNNIFINARNGTYNFAIANYSNLNFTATTSDYNLLQVIMHLTNVTGWRNYTLYICQMENLFRRDSHSINPTYSANASNYTTNTLALQTSLPRSNRQSEYKFNRRAKLPVYLPQWAGSYLSGNHNRL